MFAAFTMGLIGSLHCVAMCGPLLLSLPFGAQRGTRAYWNALLYHLGRIGAYVAIGAVLGFGGRQLVSIPHVQQVLTLGAGLLLLGMVLFGNLLEQHLQRLPGFAGLLRTVHKGYAALVQKNSGSAIMGLGALNGLIPCGMVYAAAVGAMSTGTVAYAATFMGLYGAGTLPLLLVLQWLGVPLAQKYRPQIRRAQPILLFALGLFFVYRGLFFNAGILEYTVPPASLDCH